MKNLTTSVALCLGLLSASGANAALVSALGGQAVNDTDLNITWLANANLAATNTFGLSYGVNYGTDIYGDQSVINSNGTMTWGGAKKWIGAMNAANYLGYSDWRLPTTGPVNGSAFNYNLSYNGSTDYGYNVSAPGTAYAGSTGSEMAHLFFGELSNKSYCPVSTNCSPAPQPGWGLTNTGPFTNFQSYVYWSGTEYAPGPYDAWNFGTNYGIQYSDGFKSNGFYALAVRPGQVAAVPVPGAAWLLGSGLLGFIGFAKK